MFNRYTLETYIPDEQTEAEIQKRIDSYLSEYWDRFTEEDKKEDAEFIRRMYLKDKIEKLNYWKYWYPALQLYRNLKSKVWSIKYKLDLSYKKELTKKRIQMLLSTSLDKMRYKREVKLLLWKISSLNDKWQIKLFDKKFEDYLFRNFDKDFLMWILRNLDKTKLMGLFYVLRTYTRSAFYEVMSERAVKRMDEDVQNAKGNWYTDEELYDLFKSAVNFILKF